MPKLSWRPLPFLAALLALGVSGGGEAHSESACLGTSRTVEVNSSQGHFFNGLESGLGLRDGEVVLTFDDGPIPGVTPKVLDALQAECTRATFFMAGQMASSYTNLAQRVRREGHTVAGHTFGHEKLPTLSTEAAGEAIDKGNRAIQKATGLSELPFFRYPYLAKNAATDELVKSRGLIAFGANIDSKDYRNVSADAVHDKVMAQLRQQRKGIVLMHDIQRRTASMLPRLLDSLKAEGFRVVHLVPGDGAPDALQVFARNELRLGPDAPTLPPLAAAYAAEKKGRLPIGNGLIRDEELRDTTPLSLDEFANIAAPEAKSRPGPDVRVKLKVQKEFQVLVEMPLERQSKTYVRMAKRPS